MTALVMTANDSFLQTKAAFVTGVVGLCFDSLCAFVACGLCLASPPGWLICCGVFRICSGVGLGRCLLNSSEVKCFGLFVHCLLRRCRALTPAIGPVVQGVASALRAGMKLVDLLSRAFFPR